MPRVYNPQANIQRFIECVKKSLIDNPEYFEKLDFSEVTTFRIGCNNTFENIKCKEHTDKAYSVASKVYTKPKYTPCIECRSILRGRKQTGEASNGKMSVKDINKVINPKGITFVDESDYEQNANNYNYKTQFHCSKHDLVYIESPKNVMARGIETTCCPKCKEEFKVKSSLRKNKISILDENTIITHNSKARSFEENLKHYALLTENRHTFIKKDFIKEKIHFKCNEHGREFTTRLNRSINKYLNCPECFPFTNIELKIKDILDKYNIKYNPRDTKVLNTGTKMELDFFLPDYNIGIECHGIYWHSGASYKKSTFDGTPHQKYTNYDKQLKDKMRNKYYACSDNDIQLLVFFEDEILNKTSQIEKIILNKCNLVKDKIYARNTEAFIYSKSSKDLEIENMIDTYMDTYHIQGKCKYSDAVLLLNDDNISAIMLFSHVVNERGKVNISTRKELIRFASSINVVGGFSKCLKNYLKENPDVDEIISYSDNRYSNGKTYRVNNFKIEGYDTSITMSYEYCQNPFKGRLPQSKFQKRNFPRLKDFFYQEDLTDLENCFNNGYFRIWNLGRKKWVFNR